MCLAKGSQGHACTLWTCTGGRRVSNTLGLLLRGGFLFHLSGASGRLRCAVTGMPPQPNSPSERCPEAPIPTRVARSRPATARGAQSGGAEGPHSEGGPWFRHCVEGRRLPFPVHSMSKTTVKVVVFHCRTVTWRAGTDSGGPEDWGQPPTRPMRLKAPSHLCYTRHAVAQCQTRVKLNRVFFPRWRTQARSLGCWFTG
jgi:hypothetical protein